jgi:hypothetical protein
MRIAEWFKYRARISTQRHEEAERFFSILKPGVVFGENCFEEVICISQSTTTKIFVLNSGLRAVLVSCLIYITSINYNVA